MESPSPEVPEVASPTLTNLQNTLLSPPVSNPNLRGTHLIPVPARRTVAKDLDPIEYPVDESSIRAYPSDAFVIPYKVQKLLWNQMYVAVRYMIVQVLIAELFQNYTEGNPGFLLLMGVRLILSPGFVAYLVALSLQCRRMFCPIPGRSSKDGDILQKARNWIDLCFADPDCNVKGRVRLNPKSNLWGLFGEKTIELLKTAGTFFGQLLDGMPMEAMAFIYEGLDHDYQNMKIYADPAFCALVDAHTIWVVRDKDTLTGRTVYRDPYEKFKIDKRKMDAFRKQYEEEQLKKKMEIAAQADALGTPEAEIQIVDLTISNPTWETMDNLVQAKGCKCSKSLMSEMMEGDTETQKAILDMKLSKGLGNPMLRLISFEMLKQEYLPEWFQKEHLQAIKATISDGKVRSFKTEMRSSDLCDPAKFACCGEGAKLKQLVTLLDQIGE